MISSHEMEAMNPTSPKDRLRQLVVVTFFGTLMLSYYLYDAGLFNPITITEDIFTVGGKFVYKTVARDYLTSTGSMRTLSDDLLLPNYDFQDNQIFSLLLDNVPKLIPTTHIRIIVGTVLQSDDDADSSKENINTQRMLLLSKNDQASSSSPSTGNVYSEYKDDDPNGRDGRSKRFWNSLDYEIDTLPAKTNVAVTRYRFSDGFLSSLIHFYKVVPAIVQYMQEKGILHPIIIYTCNTSQRICTFYAPLENTSQFRLNELDTNQYASELIKEKRIEEKGSTTADEKTSSEKVTNDSEL